MSETCENCRFWLQTVKLTDSNSIGQCRVGRPVISESMLDHEVDGDECGSFCVWAGSIWPITVSESWCGEFRAKKQPPPRIPSVKEFMAAIEENRVHIHSTKAISGILNTQDDEPDFETNFWVDVVANRRWTFLDNVGPVTARYMDTILDKIRASE